MNEEYISLEALAATLGLPQTFLRRLADQREIPSLNVNGRLRFDEGEVREALNRIAASRKEASDGR